MHLVIFNPHRLLTHTSPNVQQISLYNLTNADTQR